MSSQKARRPSRSTSRTGAARTGRRSSSPSTTSTERRCLSFRRPPCGARLISRRRGRGDAYSEYWCAFDIDEHPNVARALELAASSGVKVCVTNPCIELWFLLHFQDQNAAIHRHDAQRKATDYLNCGKTPSSAALAALADKYEGARRRAQALDRKHDLDGSPPRSNPSSEAWRLIETIRQTKWA